MAKIEYRPMSEDAVAEIERQYDVDATPELIKQYLARAYVLTDQEAHDIVTRYAEIVTDGVVGQMSATYMGDLLRTLVLMEKLDV